MNKEKLIKLRKKVNEMFFKKRFLKNKLLKMKTYLGILLRRGRKMRISHFQTTKEAGKKEDREFIPARIKRLS